MYDSLRVEKALRAASTLEALRGADGLAKGRRGRERMGDEASRCGCRPRELAIGDTVHLALISREVKPLAARRLMPRAMEGSRNI